MQLSINTKKLLIICTVVTSMLANRNICTAQQDTLTIASFNIANFGDSDEYKRSLIALVNIIKETNADIIAIQEVEPVPLGHDQVQKLTELLNKAAKYYNTEEYNFIVSDTYTGDETTAFLWRSPVELIDEVISLLPHAVDSDNDNIPAFQRVPSFAYFQVGELNFYLLNCHLYTKLNGATSEGRGEEFKAIRHWIENLSDEADAIIVGDFNRFLNGKSEWDELMFDRYSQHYRFPLLEAIKDAESSFDPLKDEAPQDQYSTTTAKKRSIYDQIIVTSSLYPNISQNPKLGNDVGIIAFDNDPHYEWFIDKWSDATRILSDHRPIWINIYY